MQTIPRPPQKPIVGNILDLSSTSPLQDLVALAREMGPIFELDMMGKPFTVVWGHALVEELCDEKRFDKSVTGSLNRVRRLAGDGLFTAFTSEPNWSKAHNILLPNFSERAIAGYYPAMLDVAEQMMLKWERLNADDEIDVTRDMTALTLDTIGLCGFGYRFNSFYRDDNHPFVTAMVESLEITMSERGLPFEEIFTRARARKMEANVRFINGIVDRIIAERRAERDEDRATRKRDLLDYMLEGVDRKSGERLDDTNIRYQIITFLIAGHETTSGLLSFATYYLLNDPAVLERARDEVDRVLGDDPTVPPTVKQVRALTYVQAVLKEALRLWPTAPAFAVRPYKDEIVGGQYLLKARSHVMLLLPMLHRDKAVWGERAEVFDPENFSPAAEASRPRDAYKPFGNGRRACIGMQFALQEATLVIGMMLQRFKLIDHRRYALRVKETLTVKPDGLTIKVRPRAHHARNGSAAGLSAAPAMSPVLPADSPSSEAAAVPRVRNGVHPDTLEPAAAGATVPAHGTPLLVLFGSNLGTSEDIARHVAETGAAQGFDVNLAWLDDYTGKLPTTGAVAIVTASYNGAPPDNAAGFYRWLNGELAPSALAGVKYTVFGAGNRNWASTYQAVPRTIDERLAAHGAQRIFERGEGDARDDLDADFQTWKAALWPALARAFGIAFEPAGALPERPPYAVEFVAGPPPNPLAASHGATTMRVLDNRELQTGDVRSTRHLEVALPEGVSYRVGDHLGVLPSNGEALVERVMRRFGFEPGTYVRLRSPGAARIASLPLDATLSVRRLLMHYVELQAVATRKQIAALAEASQCPDTKAQLSRLADDSDAGLYKAEIKAKRTSVIALLERFPACELPFIDYLPMLPLMTPRYYSISSSPLTERDRCSVTVGVVRGPSSDGGGEFEGVCSNHLAGREPGSRINAFVKESKSGFAFPNDPAQAIVMIGPGTGLAPFRGFLEERRALQARGVALGRALLFFGCRHPNEDFIYREELEAAAALGLVELHVAFSREGPAKRYVQHALAECAGDVLDLIESGAAVYVCGDGSAMEPQVRQTLLDLYAERHTADANAPAAWLEDLIARSRYVLDVWASR